MHPSVFQITFSLIKYSRQSKKEKRERERICYAATLKLAGPGWALFRGEPTDYLADGALATMDVLLNGWLRQRKRKQRTKVWRTKHSYGLCSTFVLRLLSGDRESTDRPRTNPLSQLFESRIVLVHSHHCFPWARMTIVGNLLVRVVTWKFSWHA